nr:terminase TerL endonuclease subunit [Mycobacterium eburneum]
MPRADHVVQFFEELLVHVKGKHARKRFALRDWQSDEILRPLFGRVVWSEEHEAYVRQYRIAYIEMARKNGKALDVATPLLTGDGWRKMGDLRVGDTVHAPDGTLTPVVAVSPVWTDTDCYAVRFADGAEIVASAEHLWTVNDRPSSRRRKVARTLSTAELAETLTCGARGDRRYTVDVPDALARPDASLPIDPYTLGAWLGDGSSQGACVTSADPEIIDAVVAAGYPLGRYRASKGRAVTQSFLGLSAALRETGVWANKHVPDGYLVASERQRMALLRGLMDTDGSVIVGPNTPRVEFCNTNRKLADAVLMLARSLGWKATLKESRATLNGRDCGPRYRVCWTAHRDRSPFRLERKTRLLGAAPERKTRALTNAVVSVERVPTVDTVCIQVAHPSGMFLAGESLTPTHNSQLLAGIVLYLLFADGEYSAEIFGIAKDRRQASLIFDVAAQMVLLSPVLSRAARVIKSTKRIVRADTNSVYQVIASDAASALGSNPSGVAADEILAWPKSDMWDALRSGMGSMDRMQPLMVAATTAPADDSSFGADLHNEMRRVVDDPSRAPHVFAWMRNLPRDADIWDEANWHIPNPALGDFLSLAEMRKMAVEARNDPARELSFRRYQLNQIIGSTIQWMPMHLWDDTEGTVFQDAASTLDAFAGRECWFGLDLASRQDLTALCYLFPADDESCDVVWRFWAPAAAVKKLDKAHDGMFTRFAADGWLTVTDGDVLDFQRVYADIESDANRFLILGGDADRYSMDPVIQEIESRTYVDQIFSYTNDFVHMTTGMHRVFELVTERKMRHHGNPLARWCFECCDARMSTSDPDLIRPDKIDRASNPKRIDAVPAAIMAVNAWTTRGGDPYSHYQDHDLLVL